MLSLVVAMALFESTVMEMLLVEAQQQLSTDALVPDALLCQQCDEPTAPSSMSGACAALAIEKEASVLGLQLHPLRSLDELAAVLEAQLVFPEGTPRRARRMLEELRLRGVNLSSDRTAAGHLANSDPYSDPTRERIREVTFRTTLRTRLSRSGWTAAEGRRLHEPSTSILNRNDGRQIRTKRSMDPPSSYRSLNFLRSRRTELTPGSGNYLGLEVRSDRGISHECSTTDF